MSPITKEGPQLSLTASPTSNGQNEALETTTQAEAGTVAEAAGSAASRLDALAAAARQARSPQTPRRQLQSHVRDQASQRSLSTQTATMPAKSRRVHWLGSAPLQLVRMQDTSRRAISVSSFRRYTATFECIWVIAIELSLSGAAHLYVLTDVPHTICLGRSNMKGTRY